jgi:hypothetical protein
LGNRAKPTDPLRGSVPVAKLGFPRESEGQDAHSERPVRWHGLTPSLREVNPAQRPAVRLLKFPGVFGEEGVLGVVAVSGSADFRGPGWPNGPPSPRLAPGGFYGDGSVAICRTSIL